MRKLFLLAILLGGIFVVFIVFKEPQAIPVNVTKAVFGDVVKTVANTRAGTVKSCSRAKLSLPFGGQISAIHVQEGDKVQANQLLLELWNNDLQAQIKTAEANLRFTQLEVERACVIANFEQKESARIVKLKQQELASQELVDSAITKAEAGLASCDAAKAKQAQALAGKELQQALLEKTFLRAPFDGVVAEISGEIGEYATPSPPGIPTPPMVDLLRNDCFYVAAPLDEVDAGKVILGQPVAISLDVSGKQTYAGKVRRIAPYVLDIERQARTVEVEVEFLQLPEFDLLAGFSADIEVELERRKQVLKIPTEAIFSDNQIYLMSAEGFIEQRQIKKGVSNWRFSEVIEGLDEGQIVVTNLAVSGLGHGVKVVVEYD